MPHPDVPHPDLVPTRLERACAVAADAFRRREATWRPTHGALLARIRPTAEDRGTAALRPDAIVVPTARPDPHRRPGIRLAVRLGRETGRPVVVLCSKQAAGEEALRHLRELVDEVGDVAVLVLTLAPAATSWTAFSVDGLPMSRAHRGVRGAAATSIEDGTLNDVGRKRNLAVLLACAHGWRHVLFLDDDVFAREGFRGPSLRRVRTLDRAALSAAVRAVEAGTHDAVGWVLREFDDNSVLHRIRRELGGAQDQFVGGGALLVRIGPGTPFFPLIYNEDWLFLLGYLAHGARARIAVAGEVGQEPYEAYTRRRARAEELGDVLGEAWATRAETEEEFWSAGVSYWLHAFTARARLRSTLQAALTGSRHPEARAMTTALCAVQEVQRTFSRALASQFAAYGPAWRADLDDWARRLTEARALTPRAFLEALAGAEFASVAVLGGLSPDLELAAAASGVAAGS